MNIFTDWLQSNFEKVSPMDFYRTIFPAGQLEARGEYVTGKYTGIIIAVTNEKNNSGRRKVKRYTLTDGLETVSEVVQTDDFCFCSPLSYAGKKRTAQNARMLYGMAFDVDRIQERNGIPTGLMSLWNGHIVKVKTLPRPTFIVSSGTGVHLYYVLDKPIPLFPANVEMLQDLKYDLTEHIWNMTVVDIQDRREIQQEGIFQGFRMPGTITKTGSRAVAFRTGDRVSLDYLFSFADKKEMEKKRKRDNPKKNNLSLERAKILYPEWYERRIIDKQPKKYWAVSRHLYDWWLQKIKTGAIVGHRYYCMMALAVYAKKCSFYDPKTNPNPVTEEELKKDCFNLLEQFDALTTDENNHFTEDDVHAALQAFTEESILYPRNAIIEKTAIPMNRRNGRSRAVHLKLCRVLRDANDEERGHAWNVHSHHTGRPSAYEAIQAWRELHPDGRKIDCQRETGISRPTILKHWERHSDEGKNSK